MGPLDASHGALGCIPWAREALCASHPCRRMRLHFSILLAALVCCAVTQESEGPLVLEPTFTFAGQQGLWYQHLCLQDEGSLAPVTVELESGTYIVSYGASISYTEKNKGDAGVPGGRRNEVYFDGVLGGAQGARPPLAPGSSSEVDAPFLCLGTSPTCGSGHTGMMFANVIDSSEHTLEIRLGGG
eukprot:CAMPEP_0182877860 /NCGR_PEP_ID=MMETSP0034_2-20130328/15011_1 /TAXON_ID=156128 /ORGANISM="Nephroselmis pyriformis, Strain CCMP717" /LENGTH=185 /DNA_ID=CAMNT_0025010725 /DNA_START=49 /DNA_END=603 /DNA_ORIENTATION=+